MALPVGSSPELSAPTESRAVWRLLKKLAPRDQQVGELGFLAEPGSNLQGKARKEAGSNVPTLPETDLKNPPLSTSRSYANL